MRNTPKPPLEVTELFPFLSGREKITIRLHPRLNNSLELNQSKLGGSFLWPADEPWPTCEDHKEAYIGILQLRAKDFPEIEFPENSDLFQFLWCPIDDSYDFPEFLVFWRNELKITNFLAEIPQPSHPNQNLVPNPCCLFPERVAEYPDIQEFNEIEEKDIITWDKKNNYIYQSLLSTAPGCKIGGYPNWIQDLEIPICQCGNPMEHLLTIASSEFDPSSALRWCPIEDQNVWQESMRNLTLIRENPSLYQDLETRIKIREQAEIAAKAQVASALTIGDCGSVYVFICRQCEGWPISSISQCC